MNKFAKVGLLLSGVAVVTPAFAQDVSGNETQVSDRIIVTGSYIKRKNQANSSSPISIVGRESFADTGSVAIEDFIPTLTINAGDEGNSDNFSGPRTQGTANINLRGLGVGANLVLLNNRRQVVAAQTNNDGESFVDLASLVPLIAVERIEILKDGASSLYGSDAISGVVNFITRDNFEGVALEGNYLSVFEGGSDEIELSAIFGGGNGSTHVIGAISYLDRSPLEIFARNLPGLETGDPTGVSSSGFGSPGNFVTSGGLVPDPFCDQVAAQDSDGSALGSAVVFGNLQCRWDFSSFLDLVPDEQRLQGYSAVTHDFGDAGAISDLRFRGEVGFARNRSSRRLSPSFGPFSQPVSVPAGHPQNPFGEDVTYLGRVAGTDEPADFSKTENNTWRASGVLSGNLGDRWAFELGASWSQNDSVYIQPDTIIQDWQDAINDFSFNPFGNSLLVGAGDPAFNSPELIASLEGDLVLDATSEQFTLDGHITGDLLEMPAGPLGVAVGFQYRDERLDYDFNTLANQDAFGFFIGNPDFDGERNVSAGFLELAIPVFENLDAQFAIRYESYGSTIGDTTDIKAALRYQPIDELAIRGSFSQSFKAPTLFQTEGVGTTGSTGVFAFGSFQFPAIRFTQDPLDPLTPETANVYNGGVTLSPLSGLQIDVDYWRFDFTDIIVREGEGFLIGLAGAGDPKGLAQVDFDPITGILGEIRSFFRNEQGLNTDGIDITMRYEATDWLTLTADTTHVLNYTFETAAGPVDGAGFLNAGTIGSPAPKWRANFGGLFSYEKHSGNVIIRHISGYTDQRRNRRSFGELEAHTTVDIQYGYELFDGTAITLGIKNLFDNDVPTVRDFIGYDAKTHDARQRLGYVRFRTSF